MAFKHEGHSGCMLRLESGTVTKTTFGYEAIALLERSWSLQNQECFSGKLYPVRAVPCGPMFQAIGHGNGVFKDGRNFTMPFIEGESGFTEWRNRNRVCKDIVTSMRARGRELKKGFHAAVLQETTMQLKRNPSTIVAGYVSAISSHLSRAEDLYPHGYCHGDFGFANMIIGEDGSVNMVDFTPSFIYSPLMDMVTMELSLQSEHAKPWHHWLFQKIEADFSRFKPHAEIIRMVKVLSFIHEGQSKERVAELDKMFYGSFRSSNI